MTGFQFGLSCPSCGHRMEPRALSEPHDGGLRTTAVVYCVPCRNEWLVEVQMSRFVDRRVALPA